MTADEHAEQIERIEQAIVALARVDGHRTTKRDRYHKTREKLRSELIHHRTAWVILAELPDSERNRLKAILKHATDDNNKQA